MSPATATALTTATDALHDEEVEGTRAFLRTGWVVASAVVTIIMLLPGNEHVTGLEAFLKAHNLEIGKGLLVDPRSNYNGSWHLVAAMSRSGADHPAVPVG